MKIPLLPAVAFGFLAATSLVHAEKIFVSNLGSNSITELDSDGSFSTFATPLSKKDKGVMTLAIDAQGYVYAASNSGKKKISEYANDGSFLGKIGKVGKNARGLAVDASGNVYVATSNGKIEEIMLNGKTKTVASHLCAPNALAFDSNGDLYVTSGRSDSITEISKCGKSSTVTFTGAPLCDPSGIAIDSSGNIFVINNKGKHGPSIEEISGGIGKIFTTKGLKLPKAIAVDKHGNVFVTDFGSNCVTEYDKSGCWINTYNGGFNGPCGIVIVDDGGCGPGSPPVIDPPAVPEPSTYVMLLVSMGALFFRRRQLAKA